MPDEDWLAGQFEQNRGHLRAVAFRMLGSASEAEDAVQESWLRLSRSGGEAISNLGGWLTTVVARVCLDMLRSRRARREEPLDEVRPAQAAVPGDAADPQDEALLADSVGLALLVVLDTLRPSERVAFVLHDLFGVPFSEVAAAVGRSEDATKQLASRARRRVQGADAPPDASRSRQREVVAAFLAASRGGDFAALLALLDPEAEVTADAAAAQAGAWSGFRGAHEVAKAFCGAARSARLALVDGVAGAVWAPGGQPRMAFCFTLRDGKILRIESSADPARLDRVEIL